VTAPRGESGGRPLGLPKTGGRAKGTPNRATLVLREKLAALGCDPAEQLLKIAQDSKTPVEAKVHIYSTLMPYVYPKRKVTDDSNEERVTVNAQAISKEEALDMARDLISVFGPRAAAQQELATPVIEGESNLSREEEGNDEN
jgi:hypothetical protein